MTDHESGEEGKEEKVKEKLSTAFDKIKKDEKINTFFNWIWENRLYVFSAALMIIGIIFAFYYVHIGGALVGLAAGLSFYDEINGYFVQLREFYSSRGLFKSLMVVGLAIYFLIAVPVFIVALVVGFIAIYLTRLIAK